MSDKIVVTRIEDKIVTAMVEQGKIVELNCEKSGNDSILGNIYTAKVKNIVKNINAAFVEVADGIICYYSLTENNKHHFLKPVNRDYLVQEDEILVQVNRENIKTKQPSVTANLNFTGKYLVLTSQKRHIGISKKIHDPKRVEDLKKLVDRFMRPDFGIIIRTNAETATDDEISKEADQLIHRFDRICQRAMYRNACQLIYEAPKGYLSLIRDQKQTCLNEIVTDQKDIYDAVSAYFEETGEEEKILQLFEKDGIRLDQIYRISHELKQALQEKVWLKSGGYLVIQPTEAMTVIDVNTGKAIKGKHVEKHFLKTNLEAAVEIGRQMRLRNLSGIIIVDFIDMKESASEERLMNEMREILRKDRIKTMLVDMTKLHLVEITRKKVRKPLLEQWRER
ncbi:MAG: ribonuclease E/G [Lachnospiraceae bacterium]|nr:ribonuclease E/G [Lachnospiraceae bacterium]